MSDEEAAAIVHAAVEEALAALPPTPEACDAELTQERKRRAELEKGIAELVEQNRRARDRAKE